MKRMVSALTFAVVLVACGADDQNLTATTSGTPTGEPESPSPATSQTPTASPTPAPRPEPAPEPEPLVPETIDVGIVEFAFDPASTAINAGDTVLWTNEGRVTHTVTFSGDGPDSGNMTSGATFEATFDNAGTFNYRCVLHGQMTGTVTVS